MPGARSAMPLHVWNVALSRFQRGLDSRAVFLEHGGQVLCQQIEEKTRLACRATILGHIQRGGTPVPADRVLGTLFGHKALELALLADIIDASEAERIGLVNFLEGIGVEVDPNMVSLPRQSSYVRMDGWDDEAVKWFDRQAEAS